VKIRENISQAESHGLLGRAIRQRPQHLQHVQLPFSRQMAEVDQKPGFISLRLGVGKLSLRDRYDLIVNNAQTQGQSPKLCQRNAVDQAVLDAIDVGFPDLSARASAYHGQREIPFMPQPSHIVG